MGGDPVCSFFGHPDYGPWERAPKWHWLRLFGFDIRCPVYDTALHNGSWYWKYGRSKPVAHELLHSAYGKNSR